MYRLRRFQLLERSLPPAFDLIGLAIRLVRQHVPESPRWLVLHGYSSQAGQIVRDTERGVEKHAGKPPLAAVGKRPPFIPSARRLPAQDIAFCRYFANLLRCGVIRPMAGRELAENGRARSARIA